MENIAKKESELDKLQANMTHALPPRILLAEDYRGTQTPLARALRLSSYKVTECADGMDLLNQLNFYHKSDYLAIGLVIVDNRIPLINGIEILERLHNQPGSPPVILITELGDLIFREKTEQLGVTALFEKPLDITKLLAEDYDLKLAKYANTTIELKDGQIIKMDKQIKR